MQNSKLAAYISIALKAGYVVQGSDALSDYDKKLYLVLLDSTAQKSSQKVFKKLTEKGVEGLIVNGLGEMNDKTYKIIGIKNKGISEEIKKQIKGE